MKDSYLKYLSKSKKATKEYYLSSFDKTQQQIFLESILEGKFNVKNKFTIADIACGAGTLSYHLDNIFVNSSFTLCDYNEFALESCRELCKENNFTITKENMYSLPYESKSYDMTFCWQSISFIDKPNDAIKELIRITKKGGYIYMSLLCNLDYSVDIYSKVRDHSRESDHFVNYNTFSKETIQNWIDSKVESYRFYPFNIKKELKKKSNGIGTHTLQLINNKYIQVSGGQLLNWAILEIEV